MLQPDGYEVVELAGEPLQVVDLGGTRVDPATPVVAGPQGPPGLPGPPGDGSGGTFAFFQHRPAATWTIRHNLGGAPWPTLIPDDADGRAVMTDLAYPDEQTIVVEWPVAVSGRAYL